MAVLHRKEEKIQAVLGRLPKKYNPDDFVAMFIKLYSNDWGKIKSAYIKASQDKERGTVIHMPKPELYLKQVLEIFLTQKPDNSIKKVKEVIENKPADAKILETKAPVKKIVKEVSVKVVKKPKALVAEKPLIKIVKSKTIAKVDPDIATLIKKPKTSAKKKID